MSRQHPAWAAWGRMIDAHEALGYEHDGWAFCPCASARAIREAADKLPNPLAADERGK